MSNRPPWPRNKSRHKARRQSTQESTGSHPAKKPSASLRNAIFFITLAVVYSIWEYTSTGALQWPGKLLDVSSESNTGPNVALRKAADAVNSAGEAREGRSPPRFDLTGRVVRVADGDTISVLDRHKQQHKIRFFGIDAPERDQPHGKAARRALQQMVDEQQVGVVIVEKDDYGRTVGTVYQGNTNINLALMQGGHAWWYRYHAPHERHLEAAEGEARRAGRGLWADDKPIAPWDWRRGRR